MSNNSTLNQVKWIKITTDIFDDEKIKLIDAMPDRDAILVIWFKLLTFAGRINNEGVFVFDKDKKSPYTDEMFASIFNRPVNTVRLALNVFEQMNMVEIINNTVCISNWQKHQQIEAMEKSRIQHAERQKKYRERRKLIAEGKLDADNLVNINKKQESDVTGDVTCCHGDADSERHADVTVTESDALDKIRIDKSYSYYSQNNKNNDYENEPACGVSSHNLQEEEKNTNAVSEDELVMQKCDEDLEQHYSGKLQELINQRNNKNNMDKEKPKLNIGDSG